MAAAPHLPEELIEAILSRMPAKSLLRFKTASKKWYSLISKDYKFINFHLKQSKKKNLNTNSRFFQVSPLGGTIFQSVNLDTNESYKFNFPVEIECQLQLIGSANGMICVAPYRQGDCFIWNPCTDEFTKISVPVERSSLFVSGFGYDSSSDDYKIVANWDSKFRVFSLKTNSWNIFVYTFPVRCGNNACHFNGALHWCLDTEIAAFDLAKEVFSYIELPVGLKVVTSLRYAHRCVSLWEYQGFLCLSGYFLAMDKPVLWAMKKYGYSRSWIKLTTFLEHRTPVGISTLGEVVYQTKGGSGFVKSDIQGRMSDDDKSLINNLTQSAFVYTESLISPSLHQQSEETIRRPTKRRKTTAT